MPLQKQTMTKNTAMFLISIAVQKTMTLVYFVIVANVFGPAEQGRYSAALAFTTLFGVFVDIGTSAMLTREAARRGNGIEALVKNMFFSRIILGCCVYAAMIGGAYAFHYPVELIRLIAIAGIAAVIDTCSVASWSIIRGFHNLSYEAFGGVLAIGVMVLIGGGAIAFRLPLDILVYAVLLGSIANFSLALWVLSKKLRLSVSPSANWGVLRELFVLSLPFAGAAIFSRIYTYTDVTFLAKFSGEQAVGWYSAALKVILALNLIPASVSASLYPTLSSHAAHEPQKVGTTFAKAFFLLALIAFPIAAGMILLAPMIVSTFYNDKYLPTILLLQLLSVSLVFGFLSFPLGALLAATNQQKKNTIIFGIAAAISIIGNIVLIQRYGALGSAYTAIAVSCCIFLISVVVAFPYWKSEWKYLSVSGLKIVLSTIIMAGSVFLVRNTVPLATSILIGIFVYAVWCMLLRIITKTDVSQLRNSFIKRGEISGDV